MIHHAVGTVYEVTEWGDDAQEVQVRVGLEDIRRALNYLALNAPVQVGDEILLNITAQTLNLGTGGYDFVIANLNRPTGQRASKIRMSSDLEQVEREIKWAAAEAGKHFLQGHIIKGRYTPFQQAILTLEEQEQYADVWKKRLNGFPVLVGQLHSQIAPAVAALQLAGKRRVAYIMTDAGALPVAFSTLVRDLQAMGLLTTIFTCGQAFGGDCETVTLHSALLAAKHIAKCDVAIVCQGPGNAGTGTKYGFSGIEQAQNLDIAKALGGTAIAIVRMSSADTRKRHSGISHHTRTTLELAYARCIVPVPTGTDVTPLPPGHDVRFVDGAQAAIDLLAEKKIAVTTMGRTPADDPLFFQAAACAGLV